jgi:hypothetical protein
MRSEERMAGMTVTTQIFWIRVETGRLRVRAEAMSAEYDRFH